MEATLAALPAPQEGDAAFERVYPVLVSGLRRTLWRKGHPVARALHISEDEFRQLVEEVADETLCQARRSLHEYDPERAPFTWWLFLLGRSLLQRELRRWQRWNQKLERAAQELELTPPERRSGARAFRQVLERDVLDQAMGQLPQDQVQALSLFYLAELTRDEVGTVMNKTPEAVSSLLQRGRQNLRDRLVGVPRRSRGRPRKGGTS